MAKKEEVQVAKAYTKQQILQSKKYPQKDVLNAILNEGEKYTHDQVQITLEEFLKKEVR